MESYSARYGLFGVTIALVGWLLCIAVLVVASTVVAAELDCAPERWAQRFRALVGIVESASLPRPGAKSGCRTSWTSNV